jgi:23S rRNA pseudouridine1911/1915/1917 synthase
MKTTDMHYLTVSESENGWRIDKYLAEAFSALSRSRVQKLIVSGHVACNDRPVTDASEKIKAGQRIQLSIPPPEPSVIAAEDIPLDIIYEDDDLLVINKPPGLTVHPAPGNRQGTLVNALLAHCKGSLSGIGGVERPGIVHRLDKDTSGLLVVAKNDAAHASLSSQLADRSLKRTYLAVVWGVPKPKQGTIKGNISRSSRDRKKMAVVKTGGKVAVTHYTVQEKFGDVASLVECRLETGRTHQIRVHFTHTGHSLVGDQTYGKKKRNALPELANFPRQALHAFRLDLMHPQSSKMMHFEAPIPADLMKIIDILRPLVIR